MQRFQKNLNKSIKIWETQGKLAGFFHSSVFNVSLASNATRVEHILREIQSLER